MEMPATLNAETGRALDTMLGQLVEQWKLMRKSCLGSGDFFGKEKTSNMEPTSFDMKPTLCDMNPLLCDINLQKFEV